MKKICIGIDVSKETLDVTVIHIESYELMEKLGYSKFENRPSGFRSMTAWVRKVIKSRGQMDEALFCMETTGSYDLPLCHWLHKNGLNVWRESALQIHCSKGFQRGKSDKEDSEIIAQYAARHQNRYTAFVPDAEAIADLKELICYRDSLVKRRKECKVRLANKKETLVNKNSKAWKCIERLSKAEIKRLDKVIGECDEEIRNLMKEDEQMEKNYQHLTSIVGIGLINSAALIAYTGNFKKITTPNKMSCYCGCFTFYEDSGTSVHRKSPYRNACCKMLKGYLRMAAKSAMLANTELKKYSERLREKGKPYAVILNNVANKLLHIMFSLVKHDYDYEYNHEVVRRMEREIA